jgi:hypothetical protein
VWWEIEDDHYNFVCGCADHPLLTAWSPIIPVEDNFNAVFPRVANGIKFEYQLQWIKRLPRELESLWDEYQWILNPTICRERDGFSANQKRRKETHIIITVIIIIFHPSNHHARPGRCAVEDLKNNSKILLWAEEDYHFKFITVSLFRFSPHHCERFEKHLKTTFVIWEEEESISIHHSFSFSLVLPFVKTVVQHNSTAIGG